MADLIGDHFSFRFTSAYAAASRMFGVTPARAEAVVGVADLAVRFGPWGMRTPLDNISAVTITGPYRFVKTAGPARLALTDSGLTFASNGDRGVLLSFREKVRGSGPYGVMRHCELTVTVEDIDGFVARIRPEVESHPAG